MSEFGPADEEIAANLTADEEELREILEAFWNAKNAFGANPPFLQDLYRSRVIAGYWQSIAERQHRQTGERKGESRFIADYLEKLEKSLDSAIMITMHLSKKERNFI